MIMALRSLLGLTARERDVLLCLTKGMSNRDIAQQLVISVPTVQNHLHNIFSKLNVTNRVQAVLVSQQQRLLSGVEIEGSIHAQEGAKSYT
jgi:DNA-binding NarL/FixJ family response regulator